MSCLQKTFWLTWKCYLYLKLLFRTVLVAMETLLKGSGADLELMVTDFQNERRRRKLPGGLGACSPVQFFGF